MTALHDNIAKLAPHLAQVTETGILNHIMVTLSNMGI